MIKGITPIKKNTLLITRHITTRVLDIVNSDREYIVRKIIVRDFLGKLLTALKDNKIPPRL